MKKLLAILLAVVMVASLAACASSNGSNNESKGDSNASAAVNSADAVPDEMTSSDGKYEVAFITDIGQLKDKSFNQGTYDGVKLYASEAGKSYKYYQPAGDPPTDDDRYDAMKLAVDNGAKAVVCAGFLQGPAVERAAKDFPEVKFVFIDGWGMGLANLAGICFREEQCGYLAGYAAVMDGYTKLGFCGGGGGSNAACDRYGYGYVQGIEAACAAKGVTAEVNYSWLYGSSFSASNELQTMAAGWYQAGTEVIFACGGSMFASVVAAAGAEEGKVIGVDVDQSFESTTVITSAMKGLADSVQWALGKFYAGEFASIGGVQTSLGANENAVGLPTATWSLTKWSVDDYNAKLQDIKDGKIAIDNNYDNLASTENLTLNIVG